MPLSLQVPNDFLNIERVPKSYHVDYKTEDTQLLLLPFSVGRREFAPIPMTDTSGQAMPEFMSVKLRQDAPPLCAIINIVEDMERFYQHGNRLKKWGFP